MSKFRFLLIAFLAVASLGALAPRAALADKLELKDGRVLEGTVVREVDGMVWFKYTIAGIEQTTAFKPSEIAKVDRSEGSGPAPEAAVRPVDKKAAQARRSGAPRVAFLTLGEGGDKEMVGIYMTAKALEDAIPKLEAEGVDAVVLVINSGGGLALEVQRLSDVIHEKYKPRFRTVAWIQSAISAAAMTAHCLEEIYFMPQGNYGACTMFSGALVAAKDRRLEEVLYQMEKISARGGYDPKIMRSMQVDDALSCSIDENGVVSWFQDASSGEYLVNPQGQILTFNAQQAERFRFSKGTAATPDELVKLMGYNEVEYVGEWKTGYLWPICRAEQDNMDFRRKVHADETSTQRYFANYGVAVQMAQSEQDRQKRGALVGKARQALRQMVSMVRTNPNFSFLVFNMMPEQFKEWVDQQEEMLNELMRR